MLLKSEFSQLSYRGSENGKLQERGQNGRFLSDQELAKQNFAVTQETAEKDKMMQKHNEIKGKGFYNFGCSV